MKTSSKDIFLLIFLSYSMMIQTTFGATDTITTSQILRDGETMVSSDGVFELGFFRPGNSTNRYVGMWYKMIKERRIVWVANRKVPLTSESGILKVINPGILVILNDTNGTVWTSNASRSVQNPVAQLLDSGNLVIRDENDNRPENFLWQSFDYPTDTSLPGMKFGRNLVTGAENYFLTWKSNDDPAPGEFSYHLDPTGYPQIIMKYRTVVRHRYGPWNGNNFGGIPNETDNPMYRLKFVMNKEEVYYWQDNIDKSFISIIVINQSGIAQRLAWVDPSQKWLEYITLPADYCDNYKLCGAYGICNIGNSPLCKCLNKFVPKDPDGWIRADWENGCIRRANLSCHGDIFLKYSGIKLPDTRFSSNNPSMTLEECREECLKDCSCMAYTQLDVRKGNGCLFWHEDLIDIRSISNGFDIYIRMASSESENVAASEGKKRETILIASLASVTGVVLVGLSLFLYIRKSSRDTTEGKYHGSDEENSELPLFDLSFILKATNNFSDDNKLGEGGFGPVYKGMLEEGQEIAVKRLSKSSTQGLDEFKNEIIFISKLQHRNLVRLLGGFDMN